MSMYVTQVAGVQKILDYLWAQYNKGPVTDLSPAGAAEVSGGYFTTYSTHWGTYQEVIRPEVERLANQAWLRLDPLITKIAPRSATRETTVKWALATIALYLYPAR